MKGVLFAAIVDKITTLKDKSCKIILDTSELTPARAGELFTLLNSLASVYISPAAIDSKEMAQVDAIEPEMPGKSPSQRMRNVLFILYRQDQKGYKEFDGYYKSEMEAIINELKNNIL
jgi:hypothetical protein